MFSSQSIITAKDSSENGNILLRTDINMASVCDVSDIWTLAAIQSAWSPSALSRLTDFCQ